MAPMPRRPRGLGRRPRRRGGARPRHPHPAGSGSRGCSAGAAELLLGLGLFAENGGDQRYSDRHADALAGHSQGPARPPEMAGRDLRLATRLGCRRCRTWTTASQIGTRTGASARASSWAAGASTATARILRVRAWLRWASLRPAEDSRSLEAARSPLTHRHPGSGAEHSRRLDLFMVKPATCRGRRRRSDHHAVVAIRNGRQAKSWKARRDMRCWAARTRGWTRRTASEREHPQRGLAHSLAGTHAYAELLASPMSAARAISEPQTEAPDDIHDDFAQLAERHVAKRRRLHAAAEHAGAAEQPRITRAIWRVGKRLSRIECRLRMRAPGDEGWRRAGRVARGSLGLSALNTPSPDRQRWPEAMSSLAR